MSDKQKKRSLIWMPVVALALFVVFGACAAIMTERSQISFSKKTLAVDVADPFLDQRVPDVDYGVPAKNVLNTFNPRCDAPELLSGTKKMNIRFRHSVQAFRKQGEKTKAETLAKRDAFAMRRLEMLKALEKAKTLQDRKRMIEELNHLSSK